MASRRKPFKTRDSDAESNSDPVEPLDGEQQELIVAELVKEAKASEWQWNVAAGALQAFLALVTLYIIPSPLRFPLLHILTLPPLLVSSALSLSPLLPAEVAPQLEEKLPFATEHLLYPCLVAAVVGLSVCESWMKAIQWAIPLAGVGLGQMVRGEGREGVRRAEGVRSKMYKYEGA